METLFAHPQAEQTPPQVIILTGPSSCGKGEVAKALCEAFAIPQRHWLSMGAILRDTYERAPHDQAFADLLATKYGISDRVAFLGSADATAEFVQTAEAHAEGIETMLAAKSSRVAEGRGWQSISQMEWLEYCTAHGLLNPDRWTKCLIAAHIEMIPDLAAKTLIFDGYPRTVNAAGHLLDVLAQNGATDIRVLHLRISKDEMMNRAAGRGRIDDTRAALERRYSFYEDQVRASIAYLEEVLPPRAVTLINAHQPHYDDTPEGRVLNLRQSIANVVRSAFAGLEASGESSAPVRLANRR